MLKKTSALTLVMVLALAMGCANDVTKFSGDLADKDKQIAELTESKRATKADLEACEEDVKVLTRKNDALADQIAALTAELDKCKGSRFTITIEADVLFKPGSNVLSAEGKRLLNDAAAQIKEKYTDYYITVEGHTDSDPIKASADRWKDNWDLGSGRSNAVLRYLAAQGVEESRMASMSYSKFQPVSDSDKSKNRRAVIVVNSGWPRF